MKIDQWHNNIAKENHLNFTVASHNIILRSNQIQIKTISMYETITLQVPIFLFLSTSGNNGGMDDWEVRDRGRMRWCCSPSSDLISSLLGLFAMAMFIFPFSCLHEVACIDIIDAT